MRLPGSSEGTPTSTRKPRRPRSSPSRTASAASEHTVSKSGGISSPASVAQQRTARVDSLAAEHCETDRLRMVRTDHAADGAFTIHADATGSTKSSPSTCIAERIVALSWQWTPRSGDNVRTKNHSGTPDFLHETAWRGPLGTKPFFSRKYAQAVTQSTSVATTCLPAPQQIVGQWGAALRRPPGRQRRRRLTLH